MNESAFLTTLIRAPYTVYHVNGVATAAASAASAANIHAR